MSGDGSGAPVARLAPGSTAFNTLNKPPAIPIFFQKSPDFGSGGRGIQGMDFQVLVNGAVDATGPTGADGKVDVRVPPGGSATVQLMFGGKVVAEYEVTVDANPLSDLNTGDAVMNPHSTTQAANEATNGTQIRGTQERLRMLGYQIGHGGDDGGQQARAAASQRLVGDGRRSRAAAHLSARAPLHPVRRPPGCRETEGPDAERRRPMDSRQSRRGGGNNREGMVRERGFEPPPLAGPDPKSGVSAISPLAHLMCR